jgi:hypothetical protein
MSFSGLLGFDGDEMHLFLAEGLSGANQLQVLVKAFRADSPELLELCSCWAGSKTERVGRLTNTSLTQAQILAVPDLPDRHVKVLLNHV